MRSAMAIDAFYAKCFVFGHSGGHAFAPHFEGAAFHFGAHEADDGGFVQAKLMLDGFEGCAVFPGHFDDAGNVCF